MVILPQNISIMSMNSMMMMATTETSKILIIINKVNFIHVMFIFTVVVILTFQIKGQEVGILLGVMEFVKYVPKGSGVVKESKEPLKI